MVLSGLSVAIAAILAWVWLIHEARNMASMDMPGGMMRVDEPWSIAYFSASFTMWALMMVAMMVPSAIPMILLRSRLDRTVGARRRALHSAMFVTSYLIVWTVFSLVAAIVQAGLLDAGVISAMELRLGEKGLAAGLLLGAAAYQLSAAKRACLHQCQSPLLFVMRYWKPPAAGAIRMGLAHGLFCLGCCWTLMLLLFVGGVMNLAWIALLALVVFIEKSAPSHWRVNVMIALLLAGGAFLLLLK